MRWLYSVAHYLSVPFILAYLAWRGLRNPQYWKRWGERFGFVRHPGVPPLVWVHAVSVGEVQAAVPVVTGLRERYPEQHVLITTTTPTGCERVRLAFGDDVAHRYMPYDLPDVVERFLSRMRPRLLIIFETELWPNLLHSCARREIEVLLANARLSERSARGYAKLGPLTKEMLEGISAIAAQTEADAARFVALGARPACVTVTGSVKFDVRLPASLVEQAAVLRRALGVARNVWVAASTHEGEEEQVLDAFDRIGREHPDALLILVPRHPERFGRVASLCKRRGLAYARRSHAPRLFENVRVLVGDTMGELPLFYAASDVAFVGGSLARVGGHNMLEPAALGVPVLFGPHVFNFADIAHELRVVGAAREVNDADALAVEVGRLFADANERHAAGQRGLEFVARNGGAGARVLALVESLLEGAPAPATRAGNPA